MNAEIWGDREMPLIACDAHAKDDAGQLAQEFP
jgi:hypothetical protein